MGESIQRRKKHVGSKKGMGIGVALSHRERRKFYDIASQARRGATTYIAKIHEISTAIQAYCSRATNWLTEHTGKSEVGNGCDTTETRTVSHRTQMIYLVLDVLRKANISSQHVMGAQLRGGYWWIHFDIGWIKVNQLLQHKVLFKNKHSAKLKTTI